MKARLDPRIGILNSGKFYAFVNGYDKPETIGTLEEVETALGLRSAAPDRKVLPLKSYNVHMTFEFPAWDEVNGYWYEGVVARSKSEANKNARRLAEDDGHTVGRRVWFKAAEAE